MTIDVAFVGVDIGTDGAVVVIDKDGNVLLAERMPTKIVKKPRKPTTLEASRGVFKGETRQVVFDLILMAELASRVCGLADRIVVVMEKGQPAVPRREQDPKKELMFARKGITSSYAIGRSQALWEASFAMLAFLQGGVTVHLKNPKAWQKEVLAQFYKHKDPKERSIAGARALLPGLNLKPGKCKNNHSGVADAGNMAWDAKLLDKGHGVQAIIIGMRREQQERQAQLPLATLPGGD